MDSTKTCSKCKQNLPLSRFGKDSQRNGGFRSSCRDCSSRSRGIIKGRIDEREELSLKGLKRCSRCEKIQPLGEYHADKSKVDGLSCGCKDCRTPNYREFRVLREQGMKRCTQCHEVRDLRNFTIRSNGRPIGTCKQCTCAKSEAYRKRVPLHYIRNRYGLSPEEFELMVRQQGGKCAICRREPAPTMKGNRLHIDHDHRTGKIRGLLCTSCNQALGSLGDTVEGLERAIRYLKQAEVHVASCDIAGTESPSFQPH